MQLANLKVDKIIIHQVFQRNSDGNIMQPTQSHEYTKFDLSAMSAFMRRITDALGEGSKAVQMEILNQQDNKLPKLVDQLVDQEPDVFAVSSFDIATKLADAQQRKNIPGGIVVIFCGTQGPNSTRFLGIIKAEVHSGYEKETNENTGEISLKFVEELLLTPGTKLYKTAGFFEKSSVGSVTDDLNDKWVVMVSDYQINKSDGKAAAEYFYSDFLGCGYPKSSARTTKHFYEETNKFIAQMNVPETKKNDLMNALVTYLKVDNSTTISTDNFANAYFEDAIIQDSFTNYMRDAGLPNSAFTKDLGHIESKLKHRKISFRNNIKFTGPAQFFKDLVIIRTIIGDPDESGAPAEWTQITVKDRIADQE